MQLAPPVNASVRRWGETLIDADIARGRTAQAPAWWLLGRHRTRNPSTRRRNGTLEGWKPASSSDLKSPWCIGYAL